jgi:hypothetical protein
MLNKRVVVSFSPEEYAQLKEQAAAIGQSISSLVRQAVRTLYLNSQEAERHAAFEWLLSRQDDLGTWEEAKEAIELEKAGNLL